MELLTPSPASTMAPVLRSRRVEKRVADSGHHGLGAVLLIPGQGAVRPEEVMHPVLHYFVHHVVPASVHSCETKQDNSHSTPHVNRMYRQYKY